ncbi:MAG: AAA family ATPase [Phycisphaerales bacterium]
MSAASPDLILLKGAPGVGKSAAAKSLARHFPSGVRIEVDDLRTMVNGVKWTDQSEHRSVLTLGAQLAAGFLRSGFAPVILVDTFSGDKVDGFLNAFRADYPHGRVCVNVLHASDDVLRDRVLNREADGFRDLAVSTRINREAVRDAKSFEKLIDTSGLSPTEVAEAILAGM